MSPAWVFVRDDRRLCLLEIREDYATLKDTPTG
jgi:hypothetical protein